jgi:hypothetical protein
MANKREKSVNDKVSSKAQRDKKDQKKISKTSSDGTDLGFEQKLWLAADKLRGNMEPSDYKHVVLGLIFLKYISDSFEDKYQALLKEDQKAAEDKDEYLAESVFWVPKEARWAKLKDNARQPTIGVMIDDAMRAIEKDNESLKGVLPKDYARPALNKMMLGDLIELFSGIALTDGKNKSKDVLGRVYEYFLGQFAGAEGRRGGEFYTPRSVVRVLVEMLEPYKGRIYDPCCGSGGKLVRSEDHFTKRVYSKEIEKYLLVKQWDFAYNPSRINIGSIGMLEEDALGGVSPVYVVVRPMPAYRWFLEFSLRRPYIKAWISTLASGSVRQSLSYTDFASIPCVVPPVSVVQEFNGRWFRLREGIRSRETESRTLAQLRDTLLPKLISGELRVKDAEAFLKERGL